MGRGQHTTNDNGRTLRLLDRIGRLVFETFLKCDKLQCKLTFNQKQVFLLMIEHIETNQIVLYLPGDL